MLRYTADKIASSTKNVPLNKEIRVSPQILVEEGAILAGIIRGKKNTYNQIENCDGRMITLHDGEILVATLGARNAQLGYAGIVPAAIKTGDILQVLNLGGIIGQCTSANPDYGKPFDFEVLGAVQVFPDFGSRKGVAASIKMNALTLSKPFEKTAKIPVVFVAGTCMQAGKTSAACKIVRNLTTAGLKVAACKVTGVSMLRDTLQMKDYGAIESASFTDAGIPSTSPATANNAARTIIGTLSEKNCDVIVAELGDGIMGMYGVDKILEDAEILSRCSSLVLCANDPVGAWGAMHFIKDTYGRDIDIISGPVTDNEVGCKLIEKTLGIAAINARTNAKQLTDLVITNMKKFI